MSNDTDSNVYILGAGFSQEMGIPLQNDFLQVAREIYFTDPNRFKHFKLVFEFQDNLTKMRKFLNYDVLNLEHLFNLIEMDKFYAEDSSEEKKRLEKIKTNFLKLIEDVINEKTPQPFHHDEEGYLRTTISHAIQQYLNFAELFVKDKEKFWLHNDSIISFNYDLAVEIASIMYNYYCPNNSSVIRLNTQLEEENIDVIEPHEYVKNGAGYITTKKIYTNNGHFIPLLKLHGSINWKENNSTDKTFIVPPTWNKSDERIRKLWKIAQEKLTKAKRIIIIGYSFPDTDIYVKSLIALALNKNEILQNIYFINPDKDTTKKASESLIDTHFHKYCEYKEWTLTDLTNSKEGLKFLKSALNRGHSETIFPNK